MKLTLPEENQQPFGEEHLNTARTGIHEDALENSDVKGLRRLKLEIKKHKTRWKEMNGSEKRTYFLDYYLKPLLLGAALIIAAVILIVNVSENFQPHALKLTILNTDNSSNQEPDFEADFRLRMNIPKSHKIVFQTSYQIHYETYEQELAVSSASNITDFELLFAYSQSNYIDAIITDRSGFLYLIENEIIYNTENILSEEEQKALAPYIIYETVEAVWQDSSETDSAPATAVVPMALDISSCKEIESLNLPYEEVYLTFPCKTKENLKHIETLLHYLFEDELARIQPEG